MRRLAMSIIGGFALSLGALAQTPLASELVVSGLTRPIFVTHAPEDYRRLFIVEQQGIIRLIKDGVLQPTPFLNITSIVNSASSERGLLGLAFHPDYQDNGFFYVSFTNNAGNSVIRRYSVDPGNDDVATTDGNIRVILVNQTGSNHNGGWIGFGPDGFLYFALGDGGGACDTGQNAQNLSNLLGTMVRIDVNGDDFPGDPQTNYAIPGDNPFVGQAGVRGEIWAYGLRNHWRNAFDRLTGDLYMADVGQGVREEVNFQSAGSLGGENYGWNCQEGTVCSSASGCSPVSCNCSDPTLKLPFHDYNHGGGRCSITGGYVYRGCAIPDLQGAYFFGDFCSGQIWSLRYDGVTLTELTERTAQLDPPGPPTIGNLATFGEDAYGELYFANLAGNVYRIVPQGGIVGEDCNGNGIDDACDILAGEPDLNNNGVPDVCECIGDVTGDGSVGLGDLVNVLGDFGCTGGGCIGDADGDGDTGLSDLLMVLSNFGCSS